MSLTLDDRSVLPDEIQLVVLRLGVQQYALDINDVREVIFVPEITAIPRQPHHMLGVLNLRGRVLPVVDLRRALGLPPVEPTSTSRVVVAQDGRLVGLLADEVSQVATVGRAAVEALDATRRGPTSTRAGSSGSTAQIVVWLDLGRLLSAPVAVAAVRREPLTSAPTTTRSSSS